MNTTLTDAAGRTVQAGDTVGGTTSGRYQTTITGPVLQTGKDQAKVLVTNRPTHTGARPGNADPVWISAERLFLVHPAGERRFVGFRTPDGRTWTRANLQRLLWEAPLVPRRYEPTELRSMYGADLQPVWKDVAAPAEEQTATAVVRSQAFAEAAARIHSLPQDYELDPGRGDARELLERLAADAHQADAYPLALPWALLMDQEDLREFLGDLAGALDGARSHMATQAGHVHTRRILEHLERICGTWRAIAETQHAHNTAPGPDPVDPDVVAYRNPDRPDVLLCRTHGDGWAGLTPLTSDDLPDGGLCTYGRPDEEECGRDVLARSPQTM